MAAMSPKEMAHDACGESYLDARDYVLRYIAESPYFSRSGKGTEIYNYYDEEFANESKRRIVNECSALIIQDGWSLESSCNFVYNDLLYDIDNNFGSTVASELTDLFRTKERRNHFMKICEPKIRNLQELEV